MATNDTQQKHDATVSREALRKLTHVLDKSPQQSIDVALEPSGESITLPHHVVLKLREVLKNAAAGQPISIVPEHAELTTQQTADLLNVSPPLCRETYRRGDTSRAQSGCSPTRLRERRERVQARTGHHYAQGCRRINSALGRNGLVPLRMIDDVLGNPALCGAPVAAELLRR